MDQEPAPYNIDFQLPCNKCGHLTNKYEGLYINSNFQLGGVAVCQNCGREEDFIIGLERLGEMARRARTLQRVDHLTRAEEDRAFLRGLKIQAD